MKRLRLKPEHLFCSVHGQPFSAHQTEFGPACESMFRRVVNDAAFMKACDGDVATIASLLAQKPACCRLRVADLYAVYKTSGIGDLAVCTFCQRTRRGTAYQTRQQSFDHVCLWCVANGREQPAN